MEKSLVTRYVNIFKKKNATFTISNTSKKSQKGRRSKRQLFYSLRWPINDFNSVVNTKLPTILSYQRSTTVSLETYPFINLGYAHFKELFKIHLLNLLKNSTLSFKNI